MIPSIVIAGTHSGCGKTSIASGLMAALVARGYTVQPFKVGPDFIDPTHHTAICRRTSRNLDPYMMGEPGVCETFVRASEGADIAVVEGVMGMYDGVDGTASGSTAHVAKLIGAPVLLIVDAKGTSRSANAMVKGYAGYDPKVRFGGVIFNRVGSARHQAMIEASLELPAMGWVPWQPDLKVESRHLGLKMAHETTGMSEMGHLIEEFCNLDAIIELAEQAVTSGLETGSLDTPANDRVNIGIAWDEAFCFYYQDNLDLLRRSGANLVFFSPLSDSLPEVDALYLGGGYPELYADRLEKAACRTAIRRAADDGMPVYAECGGLVFLGEGLVKDRTYAMAGVLPACAYQRERFQALGYVEAQCTVDTGLIPAGLSYRGHEFHYSMMECDPDARFALQLSRGKGIIEGKDGLFEGNVLAGYTHAYFTGEFAEELIGHIVTVLRG